MKQCIKFNLNDHISFKPTEKGLGIMVSDPLAQYWKPNDKGFYEQQGWVIMKLFGPHFGNGFETPIETTIYIHPE